MYKVHLTQISRNEKTGPIPVSTTESSTCPPTCAQFDTCYAKFGPLSNHWKMVDDGRRGMGWDAFCDMVARFPKQQLWRHNQAGDMPGDGRKIDAAALDTLVKANMGKRGFTYTHYPLDFENVVAFEEATRKGFTVNVSCDTLTLSDRVTDITDLPQAVVLHSDEQRHSLRTPGGRKVVVCPATYRDDVKCWNCGLCYEASPNRAVIGFLAHGTKKKVINLRLIK